MPSAMIVVVGIDDQEDAYGTVAGDLAQTATFVGDPWPCAPTCDGDGYDTPGLIAQRADAGLSTQELGTMLAVIVLGYQAFADEPDTRAVLAGAEQKLRAMHGLPTSPAA